MLTPGIEGLLVDWDQSFYELSALAALVTQHLFEESPWREESFTLEEVHVLSPALRPTKMLFAGANYERHVKEGESWDTWKASEAKSFQGIDKSTTKPYAFIKLPYNIIRTDWIGGKNFDTRTVLALGIAASLNAPMPEMPFGVFRM